MTEDIKTLNDSDLQKLYTQKREELRGARFNIAGTKRKDVREQHGIKKDVARILTEVNKRKHQHGK